MKKKILFKIWKFPQVSETFVVNQLTMAIDLGYDVRILVDEFLDIKENGNPELFEKYGLEEKVILGNLKIPKRRYKRILKAFFLLMKHIKIVKYVWKIYRSTPKFDLKSYFELFFYSKFRDCDVVHIQFGTNKHPIDLYAKIGYLNCRIITSFHGHDLHFPINNRIENDGYYDILFKIADKLICNTTFLETKLKSLGAEESKIEVIPATVDTDFFKPLELRLEKDFISLITVGRVDELKGQIYGIRLVESLVKKGYRVKYTIAGTGPKLLELKKLTKNLKLEGSIIFRGRVSRNEVLELLQKADIFLMTSIKDSNGMMESQGLVTAEAQACETPVVAFNSGGIKYTILDGNTGYLIPEGNIISYTNAVEKLINQSKLRKTLGLNARQFIIENYSERSVLTKWKCIYD